MAGPNSGPAIYSEKALPRSWFSKISPIVAAPMESTLDPLSLLNLLVPVADVRFILYR